MEIAVGGQSMSFDKKDITVIICCAGMGTRLGIGTTKALGHCGRAFDYSRIKTVERI